MSAREGKMSKKTATTKCPFCGAEVTGTVGTVAECTCGASTVVLSAERQRRMSAATRSAKSRMRAALDLHLGGAR
jgi:hypothetical protein